MKHIRFTRIFFPVLAFYVLSCGRQEQAEIPPPVVQVVEVIQQDIPVEEEFIGETYGLFDISIQARVEGFLESIHFLEGRRVRKGQLLYIIDDQPFQARVAGFDGQLAEARTMLTKAESDLSRIRPLAEMNAVSQSDLDAAVAQRDAALAAVEAAEASVESARIELGYTRIYSPLDGLIGKTEVHPGDFVSRGLQGSVLNEVSRIDTILVNFHLSEVKYLELTRPFLEAPDTLRQRLNNSRQNLTLVLADGTEYPQKGNLRFVDRQVNPTTGTILIQSAFPNPDFLLRPGQFARIRVFTDLIRGGLLIPQRCVMEMQGRYSVYVVDGESKVVSREVEIGPSYGEGYWVVTGGLEAGEKVIYEGLQQARPGATVRTEIKEL